MIHENENIDFQGIVDSVVSMTESVFSPYSARCKNISLKVTGENPRHEGYSTSPDTDRRYDTETFQIDLIGVHYSGDSLPSQAVLFNQLKEQCRPLVYELKMTPFVVERRVEYSLNSLGMDVSHVKKTRNLDFTLYVDIAYYIPSVQCQRVAARKLEILLTS